MFLIEVDAAHEECFLFWHAADSLAAPFRSLAAYLLHFLDFDQA